MSYHRDKKDRVIVETPLTKDEFEEVLDGEDEVELYVDAEDVDVPDALDDPFSLLQSAILDEAVLPLIEESEPDVWVESKRLIGVRVFV